MFESNSKDDGGGLTRQQSRMAAQGVRVTAAVNSTFPLFRQVASRLTAFQSHTFRHYADVVFATSSYVY